MRWFWQQYAPPQLQEVPSLTPTLVATAEYDVLRDEGGAYAEKLRAAGTAATHLHAPGMGHNFPATPNISRTDSAV
jgi:acetyl esterase/lipase